MYISHMHIYMYMDLCMIVCVNNAKLNLKTLKRGYING